MPDATAACVFLLCGSASLRLAEPHNKKSCEPPKVVRSPEELRQRAASGLRIFCWGEEDQKHEVLTNRVKAVLHFSAYEHDTTCFNRTTLCVYLNGASSADD